MNNAVKYYLAAYNFIAFIFWGLYFTNFIASNFKLTETGLLLLSIAQGLALLEILHAILRWVKSPVGSTIAQVSSRLLVLGMIINLPNDSSCYDQFWVSWPTLTRLGVAIVSFAWSITELIRYSFYFLSLFKIEWYPLLWMRYSFFIFLYPLGVTGEWFIIVHPLVVHGFTFSLYTAAIFVLFFAYAYYFPKLYGYMWKQRKAKL